MVATRRIPPPLQLEDDNTRYGRDLLHNRVVEKDSFFAQMYETDWRKPIVILACINLIRYVFSALLIVFSYNELEKLDSALRSSKRTVIFAIVGILYIGTGLTEVFGIASIVLRRLRLIRIYVHMAFASTLVVTGAGMLVAFAYFEFAEEVVNQCVSVAKTGKIVVKLVYPRTNLPLSTQDAHMQCFNAWSSESSSQILYIFAFYFLPSAFTCLFVYTYYRQCTDPYHSASLCSQMVAASGRHPYTRVPRHEYVSPCFSPLNNVVVPQQRGSNSRTDSRISTGSGTRRRSALSMNSLSGKRSARRAKVNWFSKMPRASLNSSLLSAATVSPGLPSYGGTRGHLGYTYEMPYGPAYNSANSEGKDV